MTVQVPRDRGAKAKEVVGRSCQTSSAPEDGDVQRPLDGFEQAAEEQGQKQGDP